MRDIWPFAILHVDCRIKGVANVENAIGLSLLRKGWRVNGILSAIYIDASNIRRIAFDSGESEAHTRVCVGAAKPSTIAPCNVEIVVWSPCDRPEIAAGSGGFISHPTAPKLAKNWFWGR